MCSQHQRADRGVLEDLLQPLRLLMLLLLGNLTNDSDKRRICVMTVCICSADMAATKRGD